MSDSQSMPLPTVRVLQTELHDVDRPTLLAALTRGSVFTPNVDIVMKQVHDPVFRALFHQAEFRICDSAILMFAARFLGTPLKEKISGSDFLFEFCEFHRHDPDYRMFLLGAAPGVAELAQNNINAKLGTPFVIGCYSPPLGFENDASECEAIRQRIRASGAGSVAVALGAPKQERWIIANRDLLPEVRVFMGVGATVDFEAGIVPRAPVWMSRNGLEWAWRLGQEPRRLWRRYLIEDLPFFWLILKQKWASRTATPSVTTATHATTTAGTSQMQLLDIHYDDLTKAEAVDVLLTRAVERTPTFATYLNLDCLRLSQLRPDYKALLKDADFLMPDGIGIRVATRLIGQHKREHWEVTSLFTEFIQGSGAAGLKLYLVGSQDGVAEAAAEKFRSLFPDVQICGTHTGYIKDHDAVVADINASGANVLIIGMGAPIQEKWIATHRAALRPTMLLGVGALFDWTSGRLQRAPVLMQKLHLEWAWRILIEPKRMFRRYLIDGIGFLLSVPQRHKAIGRSKP